MARTQWHEPNGMNRETEEMPDGFEAASSARQKMSPERTERCKAQPCSAGSSDFEQRGLGFAQLGKRRAADQ
jgi:hypothetical protein